MEIRVLGAHNTESKSTRMSGLLVDGVLALDAAALTSSLSPKAQLKLKAVLITHHHYDHIRDIPALGMNLFLSGRSIDIYSHEAVFGALKTHFLNGDIYPRFYERPEQNTTLRFNYLSPYKKCDIQGYDVLPLPVNHSVPAFGYQIPAIPA
jgi:ribonuclease BN (tRNA processing enzyme)